MSQTTAQSQDGSAICQDSWQPSVVVAGDRITGTCVTSGTGYTGTVVEVIGPIRSPDCGGYRYRLADTGQFYATGGPIEPTVYAATWAAPSDGPSDDMYSVHGTEPNADLAATDRRVFGAEETDIKA